MSIVKPLDLFSINSITLFQTQLKTPNKKHNKSIYQQPLLLNDTDVISDDEDHIYTRIPKDTTLFTPDNTLTFDNHSTIPNPKTDTLSTNATETQHHIKLSTHCSQIITFYDPSFIKYKYCFRGLFQPDDYSLDLQTQ